MSNDLLPPNATAEERALAEAVGRLSDVPLMVRETWNPDTCPANLLPWLAWAFSVDAWDSTWTDQEKRDVIKASLEVHKHKGTISAIDRALKPLGYLIEVIEWWEETPPAEPYTFKIVMGTANKPVSEELYKKAERIVLTYKNLRSHLRALTIKTEVRGRVYAGAAVIDGQDTTVYPYQLRELESTGRLYFAAAGQDVTSTTIYPAGWQDESALARLTADGAQRLTEAGYLRTVRI